MEGCCSVSQIFIFKIIILFEILPKYYVGMLTFIVNYIKNVIHVRHRKFEQEMFAQEKMFSLNAFSNFFCP